VLAGEAVGLFDHLAGMAGKTAWLEKTPDHLTWWRAFAAVAPDIHFVHIQREPEAAIASYFKAAEGWTGATTDLAAISRKWNSALERSLACIGRPHHVFVSYESLVDAPHEIAEAIAAGVGLSPVPGFSLDYERVARRVVLARETHKARNVGGISRTPSGFDSLTVAQQNTVKGTVKRSLYDAFVRSETSAGLSG